MLNYPGNILKTISYVTIIIYDRNRYKMTKNTNIKPDTDQTPPYSKLKSVCFLLILLLTLFLRIRQQASLSDVFGNLPQIICTLTTVIGAFLFLQKIANTTTGLWAMFLLSVNPWHICMSGLETGPIFTHAALLVGLYFFLLGLENIYFLPASGGLLGILLFSTPTLWPFSLSLVIGLLLYGYFSKKLAFPKGYLFYLIPYAVISVPAVLLKETGALALSSFFTNLGHWFSFICKQSETYEFGCVPPFGYLGIMVPYLVFLGLFILLSTLILGFQKKKHTYLWLLLLPIISCLFLCFFAVLSPQDMSILLLLLLLCGAIGANTVTTLLKSMHWPQISTVILIIFLLFETFQFCQALG